MVYIHGRLLAVVPSSVVPAVASNFLSDFVQFIVSFSISRSSIFFVHWTWNIVLKLRLCTFDYYTEHLLWMLHHPGRAFRHLRQLQDDPQFQILRKNEGLPFSCFFCSISDECRAQSAGMLFRSNRSISNVQHVGAAPSRFGRFMPRLPPASHLPRCFLQSK